MIQEGTTVRLNGGSWRVEGFRTEGDALWVELESDDYSWSWPRPKAVVTFAELAPHVLRQEEEAARDAYRDAEEARRGIHTGFGGNADPLPGDFWDNYKAAERARMVVITVPPEKVQAVLEVLK